ARFTGQDAPPADVNPPAATAPPTTTEASPPAPDVSTPPATQPLPPGKYKAQGLHKITLMLHDNNFPQPVWMARLAAFTELIGGAMLLLGRFSRVWGLG